jgi:RNA polymerase sigma-70 factor (ECF subfamily)
MALAGTFLDSLGDAAMRARFGDLAVLEERLAGLVADARAAWPSVALGDAEFVTYLGQRVAESDDPVEHLAGVHARDLYLACACAKVDPAAVRALERRFIVDIPVALRKVHATAEVADEVAQRMRERLLVAEPGGRAKIADYSGRGPLAAWLRVAAIRTALTLKRDERRFETAPEDELAALPAPVDDPELELYRQRYSGEFRVALSEAMASLSRRERNVLRLCYLDSLTIDEIGAFYKVHRATAARWLARARELLLEGTRRRLLEKLKVTDSELESLMRILTSRLDVSLQIFLSTTATTTR